MNYQEALDYITAFSKFGSKLGLERLVELLRQMGDPQKRLQFVHVAGTNGKGSTSTMTANILRHAGYRTGLYISPFVLCFRERMQIDGEMIGEEELAACATYVKSFVDPMAAQGDSPTEFEVETAIAFEWFARRGCNIVCLEVGLGGRFDATNVIDPPLLQVITSISKDHTAILGDSVAEIAYQKAGIIKGGVTVVYPLQHPQALPVLQQVCDAVGSRLVQPDSASIHITEGELFHTRFTYAGLELATSLSGGFQVYNAVTAVETARQLAALGWNIADEDICYGVAHTFFPARVEVLSQTPLTILDGAHNPSGAEALEAVLKQLEPRPITVIMGMLADKDYETALSMVARHATRFIAVTPASPRALPAPDLAACAKRYCADAADCQSLSRAVDRALGGLPEDGVLVMCGSLYLAADLRPIALAKLGNY